MATAPRVVDLAGSAGEFFSFSVKINDVDFEVYDFVYTVYDGESASHTLETGNGITTNNDTNVVTFESGDVTLSEGSYTHRCRLRNNTTGNLTDYFDGSVFIEEAWL